MRKNGINVRVARIRAQNKSNVSQKREDALRDLFYAINDKSLNHLGYVRACRKYIEAIELAEFHDIVANTVKASEAQIG